MLKIVLWMLCLAAGKAANGQYRFAERPVQEGASCTAYHIVDGHNRVVAVPERVQRFLECPPFLSIRKTMLTYTDGDTLKHYDVANGKERVLLLLPDSVDGVTGPAWGPQGNRLMFVIINQDKRHGYTESCRIIHLVLNPDGTVKQKLKYDRPVNFTCGSICTAEPGKDFLYHKNGRIIRYKIHEARNSHTAYGQIVLPE